MFQWLKQVMNNFMYIETIFLFSVFFSNDSNAVVFIVLKGLCHGSPVYFV